MPYSQHHLFLFMIFTVPLSGCEAGLETIKAPFDATTELSAGISQATSEFTDPTTDITEPTHDFTTGTTHALNHGDGTGGEGQGKPDPERRARIRLERFILYAYDNLQEDIARGGGEYLRSAASIAGVPPERWALFQQRLWDSYDALYVNDLTRAQSALHVFEAAWQAR